MNRLKPPVPIPRCRAAATARCTGPLRFGAVRAAAADLQPWRDLAGQVVPTPRDALEPGRGLLHQPAHLRIVRDLRGLARPVDAQHQHACPPGYARAGAHDGEAAIDIGATVSSTERRSCLGATRAPARVGARQPTTPAADGSSGQTTGKTDDDGERPSHEHPPQLVNLVRHRGPRGARHNTPGHPDLGSGGARPGTRHGVPMGCHDGCPRPRRALACAAPDAHHETGASCATRRAATLPGPAARARPLRGAAHAVDRGQGARARCRATGRVTVTASPGKGLEATLELTERLAGHGYTAVPAPGRPDGARPRRARRDLRRG